jgi:hypothetical protein
MTKLLERATPRNHPHTAICPICGDRFARGRHSNRHKAAGRKTVAWSTYCSRACRQAAYRNRKDIHNNVPASARRRRPAKRRLPLLPACVTSAPERLPGSYPHTCVTRPEISQGVQGLATPKKNDLTPGHYPGWKVARHVPPTAAERPAQRHDQPHPRERCSECCGRHTMNRHERRRAAAIKRKPIPGYQHRLFSAYANGLLKRGGLSQAVIEHDPWCTIYKGAGCNCVPHISVCSDDGVTIVDTEGNGTTVRRS